MNVDSGVTADPGALQATQAALSTMAGLDPGDAELIGQWRKRLDQAFRHDTAARDRYDENRRYARGDTEWLVDTNLIGAILEILEAHIFAKDPQFDVAPSESVNKARLKLLGEATETIRVVISRLLRDAGLKGKAKRWVKSSGTVGVGWLRCSIVTRTVKDPIVLNQLNSLYDNLKRVEVLQSNVGDGEAAEPDAERVQLEANIKALQAKLERQVADGITLDLFRAEDVQVSPECGELVNYLDSPWIKFRTYKTREQAQEITGWGREQLQGASIYTQRVAKNQDGTDSTNMKWIAVQNADAETADGFVAFDEVWSKTDGVIYTLIDGINDRWAKAPEPPLTGARWYDCFLLPCHTFDGERHPQSDVQQLQRLQDEYGRSRSNFAEARKRSIPLTVWDATQIEPAELDKVTSAEAHEHVAIKFVDSAVPLSNKMARLAAPAIDPALYATQPITTDMEKVSGAQDAMQSGVSVEKTATEAQIQNSGFGARIGTRRDTLEGVLSELGLYVAQLAMQALPTERVIQIAGPEAVWPKLTVDEIMSAYDIEVKAGSTGRPNKEAKRAAWMTALPLIEKIITVVGNFRAQGPQMEWACAPYIAMLETMFDVLDMGLDPDKFLPQPPPPDPMAMLAGALAGGGMPPGAPAEGGAPAGGLMQPMMDNIGTPDSTPAAPAPAN